MNDNLDSKKSRVKKILLKINADSPFLLLPSPLIQREVLQRIYKYLSNGNMLNYEITCDLLSFIIKDINIGKKQRTMQLDKELFAVHIGSFLLFQIDGTNVVNINEEGEGKGKGNMDSVHSEGHNNSDVSEDHNNSDVSEDHNKSDVKLLQPNECRNNSNNKSHINFKSVTIELDQVIQNDSLVW